MRIINIYRHEREDGGITVSPNKPNGEYTEKFRLIADEGKVLVRGEVMTTCIDVEMASEAEGWAEIDEPEEEETEEA